MCTSLTLTTADPYFGRNLDLEYHFGQQVVITPRNFPLTFKKMPTLERHHAIIGMATVAEGCPLYAEGVNEKGLYLAGLNFPGNACYPCGPADGIPAAPYELIPWLLGTCACVEEAAEQLRRTRLLEEPFLPSMPSAPLHWHLADGKRAMVIEPMADGLRLFEDPVGVLTNNPTFDYHLTNLNQYLGLSAAQPENRFGGPELRTFGQGMGGLGLPGDWSPASRYIRAAFLRCNSACEPDEASSVGQVFHILDAVAMPRGAVRTPEGKWDITDYSCCINGRTGTYYYKTYDNSQITAVPMDEEKREGRELICRPLITAQQIRVDG